MLHLLNLLAAVALLIWGTHLVRTGILRVFGANLRQLISRSVSTRLTAAAFGHWRHGLVQSSTATASLFLRSSARAWWACRPRWP
jgi:phosphate:Na+ symporter